MVASSSICQPVPFPPLQLFTPSQPRINPLSLTPERHIRDSDYTGDASLSLQHSRHAANARERLAQVQAVASSQAQWPSLTVAAQPSEFPKTFHPFPHMPMSKSKHFKHLGELRPRKKEAGRECFSKFGKAFQICGARQQSLVTRTQRVPLTWSPALQPSLAWLTLTHKPSDVYLSFPPHWEAGAYRPGVTPGTYSVRRQVLAPRPQHILKKLSSAH